MPWPTTTWSRRRAQVAAALAADGTPVVLVLDNLHEVTRLAVHESLLRLVQRPPPGLRLVVTTRRDPPWPLSQLRLAGVLTEIRASDLAFRADETRALLDRLGIDLDAGARRPARRADRGVGRRAAAGRPRAAQHTGSRPASSMRSPATTTPWRRTCWTK